MVNARTATALARIEAATRRIEAAAAAAPPEAPPAADADLARRYEALRTQTRSALAELEQLIGSLEK